MKDFYELFIQELKDIYSAEKQMIKAMPEMIHAAKSSKLKEALKEHHEETKNHVKRLEQIAAALNEDLSKAECIAMEGLLKEGHKVIKSHYQNDVQDAAIISFAQRVEHYEIAVYGALKTFAKHLKLEKIEGLLKETIKEEGHEDKRLTEIAEGTLFSGGVNIKACKRECA